MNIPRTVKIINTLVIIGVIVLIARYILPDTSAPEFSELIGKNKIWGLIVFGLYIVLSHVVAPLIGSPLVFAGVAVFGIAETMIVLYFASLISATLNFYISRKLGRPWVKQLLGAQGLDQIDRYLSVAGRGTLIVGRILGFALFDFISYAAGFSSITFKRYFSITALCILLPIGVSGLLLRNIDFGSKTNLLFWVGSIILAGIIFAAVLKHKLEARLPKGGPDIDKSDGV